MMFKSELIEMEDFNNYPNFYTLPSKIILPSLHCNIYFGSSCTNLSNLIKV